MVIYNIQMDYIVYPELDNLSSYVSRSQSPAHIGRALGQIYLKLDGIPELPEYIDREMTELSRYHSEDLTKVREHFQNEIFRILKDRPEDPSRIFFRAYINGTNRDRMILRFAVDYGPDRNETIRITADNINDYFDLIFHFRQDRVRSYHDSESQVYSILPDDYYTKGNLFPHVSKYDGIFPNSCRNFTFQVTEGCNLRCSYCYQTCKSNVIMNYQTACSAIDDLLAGKFEYLSPGFSKSIILDFIGGDPLLEIELIEQIYEYFLQETYRLNHPWFHHHRLSMCSNGMLYFNKTTKKFFDKYARMTSFNISIDGNKSLHDSCRVQPTGEGSYDVGIAGVLHAYNTYKIDISSKMTLAPSNIPYIQESVKNLCIDNPYPGINLNVVFEDVWSNHDAKVLYDQMKAIADMVIEYKRPDLYFSIFRTAPMLRNKESSDALTNICGGVGAMLAVAPDKNYYPCIRYMPSSLNNEAKELIIGNTTSKMDKDTTILREFPRVTYMSQQNDRCLSCPVHHMCNWCSGLCYQVNGTVNERTTFICEMIKAEYLASIYYWASLAIHYPEYRIQLDTELAPYYHFEDIVPKEEYDKLENMIWQYYLDEFGEVDEDRIARTLSFMQMSAPLAEGEVTYQSGLKPGQSKSYSGGDMTVSPQMGTSPGYFTSYIPSGSIGGSPAYCIEWNGSSPGGSYVCSGPYTDSPILGILIAGGSSRRPTQAALWATIGINFTPSESKTSPSGSTEGYVYWRWSGGGQDLVSLDKIVGTPPPKEDSEEGECGTCNDTCTDSCSEAGDCKHSCMSQCNVLCDNSCDRVCISQCSDHCAPSCRQACSGCDNVCTACNWSCQNACIVTCQNECAACRQNCKNLGMSNTECKLLCRACTTMCIMNCTQSCITWNSGGSVSGKIRSNATLNDWQGFTTNNAPRDGGAHLGPGGSHTFNWNIGQVNLSPRKTNVPHGYGLSYNGETPQISGLGSINGERGDWDAGAIEGEESWYHTNDRDKQDGSHRFQDDLDVDQKNGL